MKKSFVLLVFAFLGGWCFAQSAAHIEAIVEMKTLSVGEACYLAACAGEKITDDASLEKAFDVFKDTKILGDKTLQDTVRIDEFANLLLHGLGIEKNLWHSAVKSNHYALKTLIRMGILNKRIPPSKEVSGNEALRILTELLNRSTR